MSDFICAKDFFYRAVTLCGKLASFFSVVVRARVATGQLSFVGAFQGLKMEVGKLCKCMFICSHSPWAGRSLYRRRLSSSGGCRGPRRGTGGWEELAVRKSKSLGKRMPAMSVVFFVPTITLVWRSLRSSQRRPPQPPPGLSGCWFEEDRAFSLFISWISQHKKPRSSSSINSLVTGGGIWKLIKKFHNTSKGLLRDRQRFLCSTYLISFFAEKKVWQKLIYLFISFSFFSFFCLLPPSPAKSVHHKGLGLNANWIYFALTCSRKCGNLCVFFKSSAVERRSKLNQKSYKSTQQKG